MLIASLLAMVAGHLDAQAISARAAAPRQGTVTIQTGAGSVRVVGWNRAEVAVSGDRGVRLESSRGATRVRHSQQDRELVVRVPAQSRVEVQTRAGNVHVAGVTGAVDLLSESGNFEVAGTPRMVNIEGISGNTEVVASTQTLRVHSVGGGISVPRAQGFVELSTVSGNMTIVSHGLRRGTIRSVSGHMDFSGTIPADASIHFENGSGVADLRVPAGVSARFDLSSVSTGRVENSFSAASGNSPSVAKSARFTSGTGSAEITARTVSGTIRLRRQ